MSKGSLILLCFVWSHQIYSFVISLACWFWNLYEKNLLKYIFYECLTDESNDFIKYLPFFIFFFSLFIVRRRVKLLFFFYLNILYSISLLDSQNVVFSFFFILIIFFVKFIYRFYFLCGVSFFYRIFKNW